MRRPKACPYRRGDGTFWARVRYVDESGKPHEKTERAANQAEALAKSIELVKKYDKGGDSQPQPITFNKFTDLFIPHIESQRSYKTNLGFLTNLRAHFGRKQLASIAYNDVQEYAQKRSKAKSLRTGKKLKTASVNREVALLSRMFNEAVEQGFLTTNPCKNGPRLINPEEETRRDRILSKEEERKLLAACTGRRAHLRPIIIAALETGATKSQLLRLTWGDMKLGLRELTLPLPGDETITIRMSNDLELELVPLYRKLESEYFSLRDLHRGPDSPLLEHWLAPKRVFRDFKSAFPAACRVAGIKDFRFNDLRRTFYARKYNSPEAVIARSINATLTAVARKNKVKLPF